MSNTPWLPRNPAANSSESPGKKTDQQPRLAKHDRHQNQIADPHRPAKIDQLPKIFRLRQTHEPVKSVKHEEGARG